MEGCLNTYFAFGQLWLNLIVDDYRRSYIRLWGEKTRIWILGLSTVWEQA
jgi:hypothetical protein